MEWNWKWRVDVSDAGFTINVQPTSQISTVRSFLLKSLSCYVRRLKYKKIGKDDVFPNFLDKEKGGKLK